MFAADVDGDGDVDVLSASTVDDKIAWYENDGQQSFTERTISTNVRGATSVFAADVDGDGDVDVLSASVGDEIAWFENDGRQSFTEHTISTNAGFALSVFAADVDGDGDLDMLSGSSGDDKFAWYENGGGQFALETVDTARFGIVEGLQNDVLTITARHRGRAGDADVELTSFELLFEESPGDPLTTAEANALFDSLHIYLDDGDGVFDSAADTVVTTLSDLTLADGLQRVALLNRRDPVLVVVGHGAPKTYFVVPRLTAAASQQTPNQFLISHVTEASSTAQNADNGISLDLEFAADVGTSTIRAVPPVTAEILDVTPDPIDGIAPPITIAFNQDVTGVVPDDFRLERDGVPIDLGSLVARTHATLNALSASEYELDLDLLTAAPGRYTLTLIASSAADGLLEQDVSETWTNETIYRTAAFSDENTDFDQRARCPFGANVRGGPRRRRRPGRTLRVVR